MRPANIISDRNRPGPTPCAWASAVGGLLLTAALLAAGCSPDSPPPSTQPDIQTQTLTLVTYNVLADEYQIARRVPALFTILREANADIIALQEAWPAFLDELMAQPWVRAGYHGVMIAGRHAGWRGDFILSRFPIDKAVPVELPSDENRGAVVVHLHVAGRRMAVATTHMESALPAGKRRAEQLTRIFELLKDADDAVLLGDLNFGDAEQPETGRLDPAYLDLWPALRPGEPGLTWNREKSDMARENSFVGEQSRRLDRILVRSPVWRAKAVRVIGDQPIGRDRSKAVFPSDHFGVLGVLARG